ALYYQGDILIASVVITLGILSFPLGELFFKETIFRQESQFRLGRSAGFLSYLDHLYRQHLFLTLKVNSVSQLPLLLFAFRFLFAPTQGLLANFFCLTQGLSGLSATLAFQKLRATSARSVETGRHLIQALSDEYFILTQRQWDRHRSCQREAAPFENALI